MGVKSKHPMEHFTPKKWKLIKKGFNAKEKKYNRKKLALFKAGKSKSSTT